MTSTKGHIEALNDLTKLFQVLLMQNKGSTFGSRPTAVGPVDLMISLKEHLLAQPDLTNGF